MHNLTFIKNFLQNNLSELSPNEMDQVLWIVLKTDAKETDHQFKEQKLKALNEKILNEVTSVDVMLPDLHITPLIYALATRQRECAKLFISKGANVNFRIQYGLTPLHFAIQAKDNDMVQNLLDHRATPEIDLVLTAFRAKNKEAIGLLVKAGMDINALYQNEMTPLLIAVIMESPKEVNYLLSLGADPNKSHSTGISPLGYALARNEIDIFKTLIKAGADINQSVIGNQLLSYAAELGKKEFVKALIDAGADIRHADTNGNTALHFATTKQIAQLLIGAGADENARNKKGQTYRETIQYASVSHRIRKAFKTFIFNEQQHQRS